MQATHPLSVDSWSAKRPCRAQAAVNEHCECSVVLVMLLAVSRRVGVWGNLLGHSFWSQTVC